MSLAGWDTDKRLQLTLDRGGLSGTESKIESDTVDGSTVFIDRSPAGRSVSIANIEGYNGF